jgi:hypothetical protein
MSASVIEHRAREVNVSAAFDNCFFHCYALHLLVNGLPLPDNLFRFPVTPNSDVAKLRALIPNEEALHELAVYPLTDHYRRTLSAYNADAERYGLPQREPSDDACLLERSLVLGYFLRHWMVSQQQTEAHKQATLDGGHTEFDPLSLEHKGIVAVFRDYLRGRDAGAEREDLLQLSNAYQPNLDFLERLYSTTWKRKTATSEEIDEEIRIFWRATGYARYCNYLRQAFVKISVFEFQWVLRENPFAINVYAGTSAFAQTGDQSSALLPLVIRLDTYEGHYFLNKTAVTAAQLERYQQSIEEYKVDRETILAQSGYRISSPCVRATTRPDQLTSNPFIFLLSELGEMQRKIQEFRRAQAAVVTTLVRPPASEPTSLTLPVVAPEPEPHPIEDPVDHLLVEQPTPSSIQPPIRTAEPILPPQRLTVPEPTPTYTPVHSPAHTPVDLREEQVPTPTPTPTPIDRQQDDHLAQDCQRFEALLQALDTKKTDLLKRNKMNAYLAAETLFNNLEKEKNNYYKPDPANPGGGSDYASFQRNCLYHIDTAREELGHYRGINLILAEIAIFFVGILGLAHVIHKVATNRFAFFSTESEKCVDVIEGFLFEDHQPKH